MLIGAVVVTFHPEPAVLGQLLAALRPQVARLLVVANAAADSPWLPGCVQHAQAELIANSGNVGIGAALNQGLAELAAMDAVLLMDQDSLPAADMVVHLQRALLDDVRLAAVGPLQLDERTQLPAPFIRIGFPFNQKLGAEDGGAVVECDFLITSGCLVRRAALSEIGAMDAGLFIDNVDLEWCFRASARGWRLAGVPAAVMRHRIGDRVRWRPGGVAIVHGPRRLYTIMRNRLLLYRRASTPGRWIAQDVPRLLLKLIGFSLFEPPRRRNLRAMLLGLRDGLWGRDGAPPPALD